ncbi:MAG: hypothetical protein KBA61_12705 [Spirochaetes bacterium]|jgi:hypothetical protein|nr:hypothetical protein [Spirochaetota bacterium]
MRTSIEKVEDCEDSYVKMLAGLYERILELRLAIEGIGYSYPADGYGGRRDYVALYMYHISDIYVVYKEEIGSAGRMNALTPRHTLPLSLEERRRGVPGNLFYSEETFLPTCFT